MYILNIKEKDQKIFLIVEYMYLFEVDYVSECLCVCVCMCVYLSLL